MLVPHLCLDFDTAADISRVSLDTNTSRLCPISGSRVGPIYLACEVWCNRCTLVCSGLRYIWELPAPSLGCGEWTDLAPQRLQCAHYSWYECTSLKRAGACKYRRWWSTSSIWPLALLTTTAQCPWLTRTQESTPEHRSPHLTTKVHTRPNLSVNPSPSNWHASGVSDQGNLTDL